MIPHLRRTEAKIGPDPVPPAAAAAAAESTTSSPPNHNALIIVLAIVSIITLVSIAFLALGKAKRELHKDHNAAPSRNPPLPWRGHAPTLRTNPSPSPIPFHEEEEELQRELMLRKSLKSRGGEDMDSCSVSISDSVITPVSPPAARATRSRTWHSRSYALYYSARSTEKKHGYDDDEEEGERLLMALRADDWTEHEARVKRTWEILHKKYPTRRVTLPVDEDACGSGLTRPPTIRLKTPPLLSHPIFRGVNGEHDCGRYSSLPTDLTKVKAIRI